MLYYGCSSFFFAAMGICSKLLGQYHYPVWEITLFRAVIILGCCMSMLLSAGAHLPGASACAPAVRCRSWHWECFCIAMLGAAWCSGTCARDASASCSVHCLHSRDAMPTQGQLRHLSATSELRLPSLPTLGRCVCPIAAFVPRGCRGQPPRQPPRPPPRPRHSRLWLHHLLLLRLPKHPHRGRDHVHVPWAPGSRAALARGPEGAN